MQRAILSGHLIAQGLFQPRYDLSFSDAAKVKTLAAGEDGGRQFLRFRRGQDKDHVLRRLFQRLEQRVEGRVGQHMHFIDDVHFVPDELRRIIRPGEHLADLLDPAVAGGVHLKYVQRRFAGERLAVRAFKTGAAVRGSQAVDGHRHDARGACLSGSTAAAEKVGVRDTPRRRLVGQRTDNRFLPDHFAEAAGPPGAVE